jgi:Flp pilus assembly CpaE family ATPase
MVKLLEADIISHEDIKDYLFAIDNNLDLMHTANDHTNKEDSERLLSFILENLPHDLIITDVNSEPYEATTQKVLEEADLVIVVISQSMDVLGKLRRWKESEYFPDPAKVVYVINEYDANVSAARDVANKIGIKYTKVTKFSMNPFIRKMSNTGKLTELMTHILKKDIRVIELNTDLRDLCYLVAGNLGFKINWR